MPRKLSSQFEVGMSVWCRYGGVWLDATVCKVGRAYLTCISDTRESVTVSPENVRLRNRKANGKDKPEAA